MEGLSKKEMEIVSTLEFYQMYFFRTDEIDRLASNRTQRYNIIKSLIKKKRIIKLNKRKFYLIPIKARTGTWLEDPLIIADEMMESKDYFIGGWYAAHYWHLTDQVPMQVDIYTTRRQGKAKVMNKRFVFHRTTKKNISRLSAKERLGGHSFFIMPKEESRRWIRSRR
jgi:predicted transcriptional regulator of viral defense system